MATKIPLHPKHPERICWGCDKFCPANDLACGNGSERVPHPVELFGDDWYEWELDAIGHPDAHDPSAPQDNADESKGEA